MSVTINHELIRQLKAKAEKTEQRIKDEQEEMNADLMNNIHMMMDQDKNGTRAKATRYLVNTEDDLKHYREKLYALQNKLDHIHSMIEDAEQGKEVEFRITSLKEYYRK